MSLDTLSPEIMVTIFKQLSVKDAIALSKTSKHFESILNDKGFGLWQHYLNRDFPNAAWPRDNTQYKAFYHQQTILFKIKNLASVLDFILNNYFFRTERFLDLKTKINAITSNTTIRQLYTIHDEAVITLRENNIFNRFMETPLICAADKGYTNIVLTLIKLGVDLNLTAWGDTALIKATFQGHTEIALALIEAGADVNIANTNGKTDNTALLVAAFQGRIAIALALIKAGANVNAVDAIRDTPLILAAFYGHTDIVRALIQAGADINAPDKSGKTALDLAEQNKDADVITSLKQAAAFNSVKQVLRLSKEERQNNHTIEISGDGYGRLNIKPMNLP